MELYWDYETPKRENGGGGGEGFHDIDFGNDFLDMTPKAQEKNRQK